MEASCGKVLIIGQQKAGTTMLFSILCTLLNVDVKQRHASLRFMDPSGKELHLFDTWPTRKMQRAYDRMCPQIDKR